MTAIRATMRLQMHAGYAFLDAESQLSYFARLGISHLYLSPILTARQGSTHGYDVTDYSSVNPELGGEAEFVRLVSAARAQGLGIIVDIVPNHMAVGNHDNAIWLDVLEWGRASRYANFFDIDWDRREVSLRHRVLLPFLGDQYGKVLESGDLRLHFDPLSGRLQARYHEHHFPLNPATVPAVLRLGGALLAPHADALLDALRSKPAARGAEYERACLAFAAEVQERTPVLHALRQVLGAFCPSTPAGKRRLHRLLEHQHYRLAWWRTAADEINWRRFFDVTDLAGVRVQEPAVFEIVHSCILRLYAQGLIDGVRIDHIDGLADPRGYCRRLRRRMARLARQRPMSAPRHRPLIYVEKILAPGEKLAADWQVDGTTGYSFMNDVGALLHCAQGEPALTRLWESFSPRRHSFEAVEKETRRRIPKELLGADFNACAHALHQVAWMDTRTRDWSVLAIRRALTEILVQFPVYRIYADARGRSAEDHAIMQDTMAAAAAHCRPAELPLLEQIDRWLGGEAPRDVRPTAARRARLRAIARFQQLSSPVAAKAVEDTAFYRHGRLLSRNEVGADPGQFALSAAEFQQRCQERRVRYPRALLATATHDHKRGEDLRMRLAALSEMPQRWVDVVDRWRTRHENLRNSIGGAQPAPDPVDEYMLYQMIFAAWPLSLTPESGAALEEFRDRIATWQRKAVREAKRLSGWIEPNQAYESAIDEFLTTLLDSRHSALFLHELHDLVNDTAPLGALNALAQSLIKMTVPGVPDFYQGTEFWDFSLVDPDNRRAVDWPARMRALDAGQEPAELLANWRDGGIKQRLLAVTLNLRRMLPEPFARGRYRSVQASGIHAAHVMAYTREYRGSAILVVLPRFAASLLSPGLPLVPPEAWLDTGLALPARLRQIDWRNALDPAAALSGNTMRVEALLATWPVGLWYSQQ